PPRISGAIKDRVPGPLLAGREAMSDITRRQLTRRQLTRRQITRRNVIALLGAGAVATWSRAAAAEVAGRIWKIGALANESWPPLEGLRHGLRDLGYVEGKSHLFVYRFAQGRAERFPALAAELVSLPVDLIVSWGTPASLAAYQATKTIPIVMSAGDP